MKYKDPKIVAQLRAWVENPNRCPAFDLPQVCGYRGSQYIAPALLRLRGLQGRALDRAIADESAKSKHLAPRMLHYLVHHILNKQLTPMVDFPKGDPLFNERTQVVVANIMVGFNSDSPTQVRRDLKTLGKHLLALGVKIERVRIEVILQTYGIAMYYHKWDAQVVSRDEPFFMDEIGRDLLRSKGIPVRKSSWYEALSAFKQLANAIAGYNAPEDVLSSDFRVWFRTLIDRIGERSRNGPEGFADLYPLMIDIPRLREYGQSIEGSSLSLETTGNSTKCSRKTPEEIALNLNTKTSRQRAKYILMALQKIENTFRVVDMLDTKGIIFSQQDIVATRDALKSGLQKMNALVTD